MSLRLCRLLAAAAVLLVPLLIWPAFHREFVASKWIAVLITALPLWWMVECARVGDRPDLRRQAPWMLAIIVWIGVTWIRQPKAPAATVEAAFLLFCPFLFWRVGFTLRDQKPRLASLLAISVLLVTIVGFGRRYLGFPEFLPDRPDVGLAATIGNSNELAEWAAPLFPILLLVGVSRRSALALAAATACIGLIVAAQSRAGFVALAVAVSVLIVWPRPWSHLPNGRMWRRGLIAASGLGLALALALPGARERVFSIVDRNHPTNAVRLEVWSDTLSLIKESPWLGVGLGRFDPEFERVRSASEWRRSGLDSRVDTPHQEFLMAWAEGGVCGLLLLLAAGFAAARQAWRAARSPDPDCALLGAAALVGLASGLVFLLTRSPLHHPCGWIPYAVLAGALASPRENRSQTRWFAWLIGVLMLGLVVGVGILLQREREVFRLRRALVGLQHYAERGEPERARQSLDQAAELVRQLAAATKHPLSLLGPKLAHRAALSAQEILRLKAELLAKGQPGLAASLPGRSELELLQLHVLRQSPYHASTLRERAHHALNRALLESGTNRSARAIKILLAFEPIWLASQSLPGLGPILADAAILARREDRARVFLQRELSEAPPKEECANLEAGLGRAALGFGRNPEEFGVYLLPAAPLSATVLAIRDRADALLAAGERALAAREYLRVLAAFPADQDALHALASIGYALKDDPLALLAADAAVARAKLLIARSELALGNFDAAAQNLRLAQQKDPALLDARWVAVELAALRGDSAAIAKDLPSLRARVGMMRLRDVAKKSPHFEKLATEPTIAAFLAKFPD